MHKYLRDKKGFGSMLGLVLAVAIIFVICYMLFETYFKKPLFDEETRSFISEQYEGADTSNYADILGATKQKIKDIETQRQQNLKQLEGFQ